MTSLSSRLQFLVMFDILPKNAYDAVFPHGPKVSIALREILIGQVVWDIAKRLPASAQQYSKALMAIGREVTQAGSEGLVAGWEEGDDLCPPWFTKFPIPPRPTSELGLANYGQEYLGGIEGENFSSYFAGLKVLANLTKVDHARKELPHIAMELEKLERQGNLRV